MYRLKEIQEALKSVVGWEQDFNQIDEELTETESGLYFQEAHPLMTLANVESIMPEECDNLSDYLLKITKSGISKVIQTFIQTKQLNDETKALLERTLFFDTSGRKSNTVANNSRLVGFEIESVRSMGVTAKLERIGLQMVGGSGPVKLYLFNSENVDPVRTQTVNVSGSGSFEWFKLDDFYLPSNGGEWYLVYNQDELPQGMTAVSTVKDWSNAPCGGCGSGDSKSWKNITKYVRVSPFMLKASTTFDEFPELWEQNDMIYTTTQNYGLNAEISVGCDLTDFIISQRDIFKTVIQKQVAAIALRTMAMNPEVRVNRNQSNVSNMEILYELDGDSQGTFKRGLGYDLELAYKAISFDTKRLDKYCLSCNNGGIRFKTV